MQAAIAVGRGLAQHRRVEHVIHNRDGSISARENYAA
jgi:Uncharacterized protein conserved in bacteria (DUF2188)